MNRKKNTIELDGIQDRIRIQRLAHGFPRITAHEDIDRFYGLGYMHGTDRQMQMWLLKLIGQGRASECLTAGNGLLEADTFMRRLNLAGDAADEVALLSPESSVIVDAYCRGVNDAVEGTTTPFEFRLFGYAPDAWTPADVLLMIKLMGFVGLAQVQGEAEKFIIQLLQSGVEPARVKQLFPAIEEDIPDELIRVIKQIKLIRPVMPATVPWRHLLPGFSASNNWAVSPQKSASGKAMMCCDPHLPLQLPPIWYNAVLSVEDDYLMGATMPGMPAVVMGRSPRLAWSATYGAGDSCDYYIEEVKNGRYRRGDEWLPFTVREETIHPKKRAPMTIRAYENEHGLLEGEPDEDGYYLIFAMTSKHRKGTAAGSMDHILKLCKADRVTEAMDHCRKLTFASFNWVMADREGDIGYQLGGLYPKRPAGTSGLLPYMGWDRKQDWNGMVDPGQIPRSCNPEEGFIATANQDLNHLGEVKVMTLPMSRYRAEWISTLLRQGTRLTVEDMKRMHYDRYSLQAKAFMEIIHPLLPHSENGDILREWDLRYEADSPGATLFERIHHELLTLVFFDHDPGSGGIDYLLEETPVFAMAHGNFDDVLLSESSAWFDEKPREEWYKEAIERGLKGKAIRHGTARKIYIENLFFGGKLPGCLGFDYPLEHIGSCSTIPQAQLFTLNGRPSTFAATLRLICDFADETLHANVAGGASDRRFSRYYKAGLREWENGDYDSLTPKSDDGVNDTERIQ